MNDRTERDETSARMRAITAAELIGDFMRDGLPLVHWTINVEYDRDGVAPEFLTLAGICQAETGREGMIRAYGERLGVAPQDPHGDDRYTLVVSKLRGIYVGIWARRDGAR